MRMSRVTHVYMCAHMCAHMCVINENKHPFHDFCYLINDTVLIYPSNRRNFCHVGLFSSVVMCRRRGDLWSVRSRDLITIIDRHLSEGVRSAL